MWHLCHWVPCASQENRRVAARSSPMPLAGGVGRESCPGVCQLLVGAGRQHHPMRVPNFSQCAIHKERVGIPNLGPVAPGLSCKVLGLCGCAVAGAEACFGACAGVAAST